MMTMRYSEVLEGRSIIDWELTTADHIRQSILAAEVDPPLEDLRVWTNIVRQTPVLATDADASVPAVTAIQAPAAAPVVRRRSLQEAPPEGDGVPLRIAFDTAVSYRSTGTDHSIQELISGAFDTDEDREAYVKSLRSANFAAFQLLYEITSVSVGGVIIPEENEADDSRDMTVFIIIGACAGGGALLLLILFLLWRNYASGDRGSTAKHDTMSNAFTESDPNGVTT